MSRRVHPTFRTHPVVRLDCKYCERNLCVRGMPAVLSPDAYPELYLTDVPPENAVQTIGPDYPFKTCDCRTRDVACLGCGNIVGYRVIPPCESCAYSINSGYFWVFYSSSVTPEKRLDQTGLQIMLWQSLPNSEDDNELIDDFLWMEECCR